MFTNFAQIEDWVRDFGLTRWEFACKPTFEDIVCRSDWFGDEVSVDEKIERCRKYLEDCGRKLYGRGFKTTSNNSACITCEVMLATAPVQQPANFASPVSSVPVIDEEKLCARIRKEVETEYQKKELERREKALAEELKEFRRDKESALGLMVGYLKPLLQGVAGSMAGTGARTPVAIHGVDAPGDVSAPTIQPVQHQEPAEQPEQPENNEQECPFTDEEADELLELVARFKMVEPDYLVMLRKVVEMAEAGDATYTMAKGFLCK